MTHAWMMKRIICTFRRSALHVERHVLSLDILDSSGRTAMGPDPPVCRLGRVPSARLRLIHRCEQQEWRALFQQSSPRLSSLRSGGGSALPGNFSRVWGLARPGTRFWQGLTIYPEPNVLLANFSLPPCPVRSKIECSRRRCSPTSSVERKQ